MAQDSQQQASTSGSGGAGGASQRVPAAARMPTRVHPFVQYGCSAGFASVVATIGIGVFGTLTGRQQLYSQMLRWRIILVGTTLGLYVTGTGFLPVPPPVQAVFGPPKRSPLQ